jgi:GNAT superfamily N-acetyltransferase
LDLLIKLYDLPLASARALPQGVTVRKPIGSEHSLLIDWVTQQFSSGWASEAQVALANRPVSLLIAAQAGEPLGFACYDATARGLFGPIGVAASSRGTGIGTALMLACLQDMHAAGYAYAVAGAVGPAEFFRQVALAMDIPGSEPGVYRGMLRSSNRNNPPIAID